MKYIIINALCYLGLILTIYFMGKKISNLNHNLDIAINNEKAYAAENNGLKESNRVFQFTINQLEYYNDSLLIAMKKIANDNGIKDKRIKALQYQLEYFSKKDTVFIRDTIFRDPGFILDTCLMDEWNKCSLHLEYPGTIAIDNEYKNDKYIILDSHREPVKPRKWFLPRWFTRKHTVVEITIVDQNPYVTTPRQRYVEIIDR